jgi:hypothetical protein
VFSLGSGLVQRIAIFIGMSRLPSISKSVVTSQDDTDTKALPPHATIDEIVTSICNTFEQCTSSNSIIPGSLEVTASTLVRLLRQKLAPQSDCVPNIRAWDVKFSTVLFHLLLNSTPKPCWKRLIHDIIVEEFQNMSPYDGQEGIVSFCVQELDRVITTAATLGQEKEIASSCSESNPLHGMPNVDTRWRKLLSRGCFIHCTSMTPAGWTLLHHAAWSGSPGSITVCLRLGIGIETRDWSGLTPVHVAAGMGKYEAVKYLCQCGADPLIRDYKGISPLQLFLLCLNECNWREKLSSKNLMSSVLLLTMTNADNLWPTPATNSNNEGNEGDGIPDDSLTTDMENHPMVLLLALCGDDQYLLNTILKYSATTSHQQVDIVQFMLLESVRKRRYHAMLAIFDNFEKLFCPIFPETEDHHVIPPGTMGFIRVLLSAALVDRQENITFYLVGKVSFFMSQFFSSSSLLSVEAEEIDGIDMSLLSCNSFIMFALLQGNYNILTRLLQSSLLTSNELLLTPLNTFLVMEEVDTSTIQQVGIGF